MPDTCKAGADGTPSDRLEEPRVETVSSLETPNFHPSASAETAPDYPRAEGRWEGPILTHPPCASAQSARLRRGSCSDPLLLATLHPDCSSREDWPFRDWTRRLAKVAGRWNLRIPCRLDGGQSDALVVRWRPAIGRFEAVFQEAAFFHRDKRPASRAFDSTYAPTFQALLCTIDRKCTPNRLDFSL